MKITRAFLVSICQQIEKENYYDGRFSSFTVYGGRNNQGYCYSICSEFLDDISQALTRSGITWEQKGGWIKVPILKPDPPPA